MTRTAWQILRYTSSGDWAVVCLGFAVAAASGAVDPVLTVLISRTFQSISDLSTQSITSHQFISHVSSYATGIFSVGVLAIVLQWVSATSWSYLGAKKTVQIRGLLLSSIVNRDMEWFDSKHSLPSLLSAANKYVCSMTTEGYQLTQGRSRTLIGASPLPHAFCSNHLSR